MAEEKTPEEKVTEGKETEDETIPEFGKDGRDARRYKLHALMNECVSLARQTVEARFAELADDPKMQDTIAEMSCDLAVALFHKASVPDQTETMLAALERGLKWYGQWQEGQKAESVSRNEAFKLSIQDIIPPRKLSPVEALMRSLLDFAGRYSEAELTKLSDEAEEAIAKKPIETFTQEKGSPTSEE